MLCFIRWEPVYYHVDGPDFPTNTHEPHGCFVGIAENNGIRMTIAILCHPTRCSMLTTPAPYLRPNPIDGEIIRCHVKFRGDLTLNANPPGIGAILYRSSKSEKSQSSKPSEWKQQVPPTFDPPDHNGCSFLTIQEIGECHCLRIVPLVHQADNHLEYTMFHCQPTKGNNDGIIASNEILENVDSLGNSEQLRSFQRSASYRVRENGFLLLPTFREGIKRDASLYLNMTQDHQWGSWNRSVVVIARLQAVEQVLDRTYVLVLPEKVSLFTKKQKYLYSVFERTLPFDKGKAIVRAYETTFDAQKMYSELYDYRNRSTRAQIESSTLLSYITSARLGDVSWKFNTNKVILHWEEQVRSYEKLADPTDHFSDAIKLHMLQNAVHPIKLILS